MAELVLAVKKKNSDLQTVDSFADEWSRFNQSNLSDAEQQLIFDQYFSVFPWNRLPEDAQGFDMGCGTGRWAKLAALRVGHVNCIDPAQGALDVARKNLAKLKNISFYLADVGDAPLATSSQDFGYSLGVLHHIPDTEAALNRCVSFFKLGA